MSQFTNITNYNFAAVDVYLEMERWNTPIKPY